MSHTPNELHSEFPGDADLIHQLRLTDSHFAKQAEQYHEINREIHRIEAEVEVASDERAEELKKQRLALLDDIRQTISHGKAGA